MPERRKRNRKSLFRRLLVRKTFSLGRLRRREVVAAVQSPTSVTDWQLQFPNTVVAEDKNEEDDVKGFATEITKETMLGDAKDNDTEKDAILSIEEGGLQHRSQVEDANEDNTDILPKISSPSLNSVEDDNINFRTVSPMTLGSDDEKDIEGEPNDEHYDKDQAQEARSISPLSSHGETTVFFSYDAIDTDAGVSESRIKHSSRNTVNQEEVQDGFKSPDDTATHENIDTENSAKGETPESCSDKQSINSAFNEECPTSETKPNPEELFRQGEIVNVDIVKGSYQKCKQGRIIDIKKKVKVCVRDTSSNKEKETWLARTSLSYLGEPFPEHDSEVKKETNGFTTSKSKTAKKGKDTSSSSKPQVAESPPLKKGDRVDIIGGTYASGRGKVLQVKIKVNVAIDGRSKHAWLDRKSLRKSDASSVESSTSSQDSFLSCQSKEKAPSSKSRSRSRNVPTSEYLCGDDWRLPDSGRDGLSLGLRRLVKSRYQLVSEQDTLLAYWFQSRMKIVEVPINNDELEVPFLREFEESDGSKFELAVSKIQSDGDKAAPAGVPSKKCIHLYYCKVSGPELQTISLREEFEHIANFACLGPKVGARLELFLSPAYKLKSRTLNKSHAIHMVKEEAFCEIDETGNEGCGFISEDLLIELLGGGTAAERAYAIQVRGAAAFGMFKGVLLKKIIKAGEPPIQIPSSMVVVGPSRSEKRTKQGFLVINRNGVHPNSTNAMVDRLLQGVGTTKSFQKELRRKKLSDMISRLWIGLGVPESICDQYSRDCQSEKNLQHAYVVGLADPTAQLPSGFVYIPGLKVAGEIFVTRSPCLEAADARKLPMVVTSKPSGMSLENWNFLEGLSFGSVIFANPKPGEAPLPVMIADGDLDGDLYFICWHQNVLEHAHILPLNPTVPQAASQRIFPNEENWFSQAQDRMIDARSGQLLGQIIGKLWSKATSIAKDSDDFTKNEDFKAFAAAYKEALKIGKHGGKIYLPKRLHSCLPEKFHYVLSDTKF